MEAGTKKIVMVAIIIACLIAAAVIALMSRAGGTSGYETIDAKEMMWVKCANPDCGAEYEMNKQEYHKTAHEKKTLSDMFVTPALVCNECSEESIYKAVKCGNCSKVFFYGAMGRQEFGDKCPECGYSETKEKRTSRRTESTTE
ncbi:MAG: hypothetical protein ACYS0I_03450 [Planctomycetota bacterium]|jgi:hypothetical protein